MHRLLPFIGAVVLCVASLGTQAHEGHDHMPVSMKKAVEIARATTQSYTVKAPPFGLPQLDQSWRDLPESAAQIYENGRGYYLVSVAHPAQAKTLYLRILLDGSVDAANFSGEFVSSTASSAAN